MAIPTTTKTATGGLNTPPSNAPGAATAKPPAPSKSTRHAGYDIRLDRYELKYVIPPSQVPLIRAFIKPFCEADPNTSGYPPEYCVTTLQFDTPDMALHRMKMNDSPSRFKIRARIYGEPGNSPVYMEIKRKIAGTIVKSRSKVPFHLFNESMLTNPNLAQLNFKSKAEEFGFLDFVRLSNEIGAAPRLLIRYIRESYFGIHDAYARITFDRHLTYQPTGSWTDWGRSGNWFAMDSSTVQNHDVPYSGVVLELKTLSDAPHWMLDLVERFELERVGNCKYSTAIWIEDFFNGDQNVPFADDLTTI
jgi:hypothetical protein